MVIVSKLALASLSVMPTGHLISLFHLYWLPSYSWNYLGGGREKYVEIMHGSEVKASAFNVGDPGSIPGLGRSPGEGNGNPLQYSCLENPMDGGAWWATVHGVAESDMTEQLHFQFHFAILHVFYTYEVISHCVFVNDCKYINKISGQI